MDAPKASSLLFPQTSPRLADLAALAPFSGAISLLRPPGLPDEAFDQTLLASGVVRLVSSGDGDSGQSPAAMGRLLAQWEAWIRDQQGSGRVEALKAGVKPAAGPDSVQNLRQAIKSFGQTKPQDPPQPPELSAGLLLHLAHLEDMEAQASEELLAKTQQAQNSLGEIMGLEEPDGPPEYGDMGRAPLPPAGYDRDEERLLSQRLGAWAALAAGLEPEGGLLATPSLAAARLLAARWNQALQPAPEDPRSSAGASLPAPDAPGQIDPDSPLAREVARLVFPWPPAPDAQALAKFFQSCQDEPGWQQVRQLFSDLTAAIRANSISAQLQERLSGQAQAINDLLQKPTPGQAGPQACLSLFAFPGADWPEILALMQDRKPALPTGMADWPAGWPQGSYPLAALWQAQA